MGGKPRGAFCFTLHLVTFSDGMQQSRNAKNLTCAKNHSNTKIANSCSFTMVAASKLPAYRPAGARSGQRRPNESFSEQIERITKARMASRDAPIATSAKAVPKTPPKSAANVARWVLSCCRLRLWNRLHGMHPQRRRQKSSSVLRYLGHRRLKKTASPYPPPVAPKDA